MSKKTYDQPDCYHYHELLDRTYILGNMVDEHLIGHPAVDANPEIKKKVRKVSRLLTEIYNLSGGLASRNCRDDKRAYWPEVQKQGTPKTRRADNATSADR